MKKSIKILVTLFFLCVLSLCLCACSANSSPEATFTVQYSAGANGRIEGNTDQTVSTGDDAETVTAVPNSGYIFLKWSDGVTTVTRTDTNVTADISVTAMFAELNYNYNFNKVYYSVEYTAGAGGRIEGEANQSIEFLKSGSKVTAVADESYYFVKWSDGITKAERQDAPTKNISVSAIFAKYYVVQYLSDKGGSVRGEIYQLVADGKATQEVRAVADHGYYFEKWSDGETSPTRSEKKVSDDVTLTAIFKENRIYTVTYEVNLFAYNSNDWPIGNVYKKGSNESGSYFKVREGKDVPAVEARCENSKFVFVKWSDGVTTPERHDLCVTGDLEITACFGVVANYKVDGEKGGTIIGETTQIGLPQEQLTGVKAVPDEGYVFSGWSDLRMEQERQDVYSNVKNEYVAYFEPIEKSFVYDYGIAQGTPTATSVTLNRNKIKKTEFVVPQLAGYTFKGWYADSKYGLKVVNENGLYMLGYHGFTLETNTLYACWQQDGADEGCIHKVLFVIVDSVQGTVYSRKAERDIEVDYKMSAIERQICSFQPGNLSGLLNKWFEGITTFEMDLYYTVETVTLESRRAGIDYTIFAEDVPEAFPFVENYHNSITIFGMGDYDYLLHSSGGIGGGAVGLRSATVYLESLLAPVIKGRDSALDWLNKAKAGVLGGLTVSCLHEFVHTADPDDCSIYHHALGQSGEGDLVVAKDFLLGRFILDGEVVGVPMSYWKHEYELRILCRSWNPKTGKVIVSGEVIDADGTGETPLGSVYKRAKHGANIKFEAVPEEGYRFVRWYDGRAKEAVRYANNIVNDYSLVAIFEKI